MGWSCEGRRESMTRMGGFSTLALRGVTYMAWRGFLLLGYIELRGEVDSLFALSCCMPRRLLLGGDT